MTSSTTATDLALGLDLDAVEVRSAGRVLVSVPALRATPGRPLTVIGESGAGKSLLAHAIMGTLGPDLEVTGRLRLDGATHDLADRSSRRPLWGRRLALLPQEPMLALDPTMRVLPQVAEGADRPTRREREESAAGLLASLGLPAAGRHHPHTLSGGMAQRVSYAAATIGSPGVLLVDEPSKGLDPEALDRLARLLLRHTEAGGVLVTISHDIGLARRLGGDVAVMRDARVIEWGTAEDVLDRPSHPHTRLLLDADPALWGSAAAPSPGSSPSSPGSSPGSSPSSPGSSADSSPGSSADSSPGSSPESLPGSPPSSPRPAGPALVTLGDVQVVLGGRPVLDGLDLRIGPGERWALVGPSGSGKTTLGNVLAGLQPVHAGVVLRDPSLGPGAVAKLYQDPQTSFAPRVALVEGLRDVARRFDVPWPRVASLLDRVGLPADLLTRRPGQVSGGELQRLAIVRAMLPSPRLLIADEATSRLDLLTQQRTVGVLLGEVDTAGSALVLVTHDRHLARACTDHVVALDGGHA